MQNMVLMAHALGLGAVWLTFTETRKRRIRDHFEVPSHINIVSNVAIGWPAVNPIPPGRMELEEVLIGRGEMR